jgi:signal transduction histidine kinase
VRGVGVYAGRRRLLGIDMAYSGSPFRFQLHLPQHHTETLLRDRVTELGGRLTIDSAPGEGTRVRACFPLAGPGAVAAGVMEEAR